MLMSKSILSFGFEIDIPWGFFLTETEIFKQEKSWHCADDAADVADADADANSSDIDDNDDDDGGVGGHLHSAPPGENPPRSNSNFRIAATITLTFANINFNLLFFILNSNFKITGGNRFEQL